VWLLTEDAIKNGVQSTTRYRKTGAGKKPLGGRMPALQRQRAGARGGRAARKSAKRRNQDQSAYTDPMSTASPSTTSYSDYGDYQFEYHDPRPVIRSWPVTPLEDHLAAQDLSTCSPLSQHIAYGGLACGGVNTNLQHTLVQTVQDQHMGGLLRFQAD
jgi:hypothetical protein